MKRLPDTELEVMKALWASGPDTPRAALDHALADFQWSPNTINTYLNRLADKGFVSVRREGKSNRYTPLVSREDYLAFDSRMVLSRLYGSSPRNFVAALAKGGLEQKDLEDLRDLLDELSGGESHEWLSDPPGRPLSGRRGGRLDPDAHRPVHPRPVRRPVAVLGLAGPLPAPGRPPPAAPRPPRTAGAHSAARGGGPGGAPARPRPRCLCV